MVDLRSLAEAPGVAVSRARCALERRGAREGARSVSPPEPRIVLCCRTGVRAWRAARALQGPGPCQRRTDRARRVTAVLRHRRVGLERRRGPGARRADAGALRRAPRCARVTAMTAQSDAQLTAVHLVPPDMVRAQIEAAFATRRVGRSRSACSAARPRCSRSPQALQRASRCRWCWIRCWLPPPGVSCSMPQVRAALRESCCRAQHSLTPNIPEAAALLGTTPAPDAGASCCARPQRCSRSGRARCCSRAATPSGDRQSTCCCFARAAALRLSRAALRRDAARDRLCAGFGDRCRTGGGR